VDWRKVNVSPERVALTRTCPDLNASRKFAGQGRDVLRAHGIAHALVTPAKYGAGRKSAEPWTSAYSTRPAGCALRLPA